ncbi:MAG: ATP-binding cassette domain-containing protein [Deltaproteobacteria bacterium]
MNLEDPALPVVKAIKLSKNFGKRRAVDSIDFVIRKGDCFGFLGPNGAGKTTTILMILGLVEKSDGSLQAFGKSIPEHLSAIKQRVGVVPQNDNLDSELTVWENLLTYGSYFNLPTKVVRKRSDDLLHFFALSNRKKDIIEGLSGGQRRRLLLARALIHEPDLLVLDEPTVGLDPQARHLIWQRLQSLREKGMTILLTSHYMDEVARLSNRVLIIDHGKILVEGEPGELVEKFVGVDVYEIEGREEELTALEKLAANCRARCERISGGMYIYLHDRCEQLSAGIQASTQWLRRPANLEDLFIQLTGRSLRES